LDQLCVYLAVLMRFIFQISAVLLGFAALFANAQDCQLVVPPQPLTAAGLATPYVLQAAPGSGMICDAANKDVSAAFVHAVVVDPVNGNLAVYNPLVISAGTAPAIQPTVPQLPANAVVGIWFGYNGGNLQLVDTPGTTSLAQGNCVPGMVDPATGAVDVFGQFSYCNAPNFFQAANNLIDNGKIAVPALGNAMDGKLCPNVRSWDVVDQDQSDNVPTQYLVDVGNTGLLAQNTAANRAALGPNAMILGNPSDNALTTNFIMPASGCAGSVWKVPDLADPGNLVTALPLNELQAAKFAQFPQALIPLTHAMALMGGTTPNANKVNLYRVAVNQPMMQVNAANPAVGAVGEGNPATYCKLLNQQGGPRLAGFKQAFLKFASPDAMHASLYTFLTDRFATSNQLLMCQANGVVPFTNF
jgi:hypothetical protein